MPPSALHCIHNLLQVGNQMGQKAEPAPFDPICTSPTPESEFSLPLLPRVPLCSKQYLSSVIEEQSSCLSLEPAFQAGFSVFQLNP